MDLPGLRCIEGVLRAGLSGMKNVCDRPADRAVFLLKKLD